ncbi:TIGR02594 family protein [Novosphingobium sp. JCM 18896]|nr:TIGR02594 family protein [Novosphingobium sp. JCM 18896]
MPWFQEARRLIGVREAVGPRNNPLILDWANQAGIDYGQDDRPWCGLFTAHCISSTLVDEALPNNPLGARNWLRFGAACEPQLGAVIVFWREDRDNSWAGHVGFYAGEDDDAYHVLGGNQGDAVSITRIARARKLGTRWPATVPAGSGRPLKLAAGKTFFSTNEA